MKLSKYLYIILTFLLVSESKATIRTLNNNNPSPGQYTTWAAVQAACGFNDTVLVSGSPVSYGNITINVFGLALIGTGHNPQKQNPLVSSFDTIVFTVGTVSFDGIKAQLIRQSNPFGATSVSIQNCMTVIDIQGAVYDAYYTLRNNILYQYKSDVAIRATFNDTYSTPALICDARNNIIFGSILLIGIIYNVDSALMKNSNFSNNVFMRRGDGQGGINGTSYNELFVGDIGFSNFVFNNNIVNNYNGFHLGSTFSNTACLNNCVRYGGVLFTSFPNDNATTFGNVLAFANFCPSLCAFSYAQDYHLEPTSPLINAGSDGTDIGVYGGPYGSLFSMYGEPSIPQIKQMNTPSSVVSGNSFNVNITTTIK